MPVPLRGRGRGARGARWPRPASELVLLNTPPGDFAAGERGLAGLPGREAEFEAALGRALAYAEALDCPQIHVMAGVQPADTSKEACLGVYKANLRLAAEACARAGRTALIEPINTRDIPGFLLNTPDEGAARDRRARRAQPQAAVRLLPRPDHGGAISPEASSATARSPATSRSPACPSATSRTGARSTTPICSQLLDRLGYAGWVGCEYFPAGPTEDGLGWAIRHGIAPKGIQLATGGERV